MGNIASKSINSLLPLQPANLLDYISDCVETYYNSDEPLLRQHSTSSGDKCCSGSNNIDATAEINFKPCDPEQHDSDPDSLTRSSDNRTLQVPSTNMARSRSKAAKKKTPEKVSPGREPSQPKENVDQVSSEPPRNTAIRTIRNYFSNSTDDDSDYDDANINPEPPVVKSVVPELPSEVVVPRTQRLDEKGEPVEEKCNCHHHQAKIS